MPPRRTAGLWLHLAWTGQSSGAGPFGLVLRSASSALCLLLMGLEEQSGAFFAFGLVATGQSMVEIEQELLQRDVKLDWFAAVWAWVRGRGGATGSTAVARADHLQH